jgi:hypothetical protein
MVYDLTIGENMKTARKLNLIIAGIFLSWVLTGCNDPKSKMIPEDMTSKNTAFKEAIEKLNEDDKKALMGYLMRSEMKKAFNKNSTDTQVAISIGEAIDHQNKWLASKKTARAEQQALKDELASKKAENQMAMNETVTVSFLAKKYEKVKYRDHIALSFGFKNKTSKNIIGVKGVAHLKDIFGDTILRVTISDDQGIKARASTKWNGSIDYNQFKNSDIKLRNTAFDKIVFEWEPGLYLFSDGTKLKAE